MTATKTSNLDKFRQVYSDAVIPLDLDGDEWKAAIASASETRELQWKGERIPLTDAAEAYATLCGGYNEFKPNMLADLLAEFPDAGIEVTPAREWSVAVYLHVPAASLEAVMAFVEANWEADEVDRQDGGTLRVWWD